GCQALLLLLVLELVVRVAPQRADLDPAFLDFLVQLLHEVLSALLVERRYVEPDDGSVVSRCESEVRREDRLLDRLDEVTVPRLNDDLARLGRADRGERDKRCCRAVCGDLALLDEPRAGGAR